MHPQIPAEIPTPTLISVLIYLRKKMREVFDTVVGVFKVQSLFTMTSWWLKAIGYLYGVRGNRWDYPLAFKTALIFYLTPIRDKGFLSY